MNPFRCRPQSAIPAGKSNRWWSGLAASGGSGSPTIPLRRWTMGNPAWPTLSSKRSLSPAIRMKRRCRSRGCFRQAALQNRRSPSGWDSKVKGISWLRRLRAMPQRLPDFGAMRSRSPSAGSRPGPAISSVEMRPGSMLNGHPSGWPFGIALLRRTSFRARSSS